MVFLQRDSRASFVWSDGRSGRRDFALAGIFALVPARAAAASLSAASAFDDASAAASAFASMAARMAGVAVLA